MILAVNVNKLVLIIVSNVQVLFFCNLITCARKVVLTTITRVIKFATSVTKHAMNAMDKDLNSARSVHVDIFSINKLLNVKKSAALIH